MGVNGNEELYIFADNIAYFRKEYNYSKNEMAKILGIGVGSIAKIERGEIPKRMSVDVVFTVGQVFSVKPADLFKMKFSEQNSESHFTGDEC